MDKLEEAIAPHTSNPSKSSLQLDLLHESCTSCTRPLHPPFWGTVRFRTPQVGGWGAMQRICDLLNRLLLFVRAAY
jgi:hypothetical protein